MSTKITSKRKIIISTKDEKDTLASVFVTTAGMRTRVIPRFTTTYPCLAELSDLCAYHDYAVHIDVASKDTPIATELKRVLEASSSAKRRGVDVDKSSSSVVGLLRQLGALSVRKEVPLSLRDSHIYVKHRAYSLDSFIVTVMLAWEDGRKAFISLLVPIFFLPSLDEQEVPPIASVLSYMASKGAPVTADEELRHHPALLYMLRKREALWASDYDIITAIANAASEAWPTQSSPAIRDIEQKSGVQLSFKMLPSQKPAPTVQEVSSALSNVEQKPADMVHTPKHYQFMTSQSGDVIEVIDIRMALVDKASRKQMPTNATVAIAEAVGYLLRCADKHDNPIEDIKKARQYLNLAVNILDGNPQRKFKPDDK